MLSITLLLASNKKWILICFSFQKSNGCAVFFLEFIILALLLICLSRLMNSTVYNYIIQSSSNTLGKFKSLVQTLVCGVVSDVLIYFLIDEATTLFIIKHIYK